MSKKILEESKRSFEDEELARALQLIAEQESRDEPKRKKMKLEPSKPATEEKPIMLLKNHGNSCYINATLQLLNNLTFSNLERVSPDPQVNIILDLIRNPTSENLENVLTLANYQGNQEDTREFLTIALNLLQENGYIHTAIRETTMYINTTPMILLSSSEESKTYTTIQDYLTNYKKDMNIEIMPLNDTQNIIILLPRFTDKKSKKGNYFSLKKKTEIIPNEEISFTNGIKYRLSGCIIHEGTSMNNGHYTYLTFKNGTADKYIDDHKTIDREDPKNEDNIIPGTFDDYVTKYNPKIALGNYLKNGYVYLYTKIPGSTATPFSIAVKENWNCNMCTFDNDKDSYVCTMCYVKRTDGTKLELPCGTKRARSPVKKAAKPVTAPARSPVKKAAKPVTAPARSPVKKAPARSPVKKAAPKTVVTAPARSPVKKAAPKPVAVPVSSPIKKIRSSPKKKVTPEKSIMPLTNIGNSCFINAALQLVDNLQLTNMNSNMTTRDTKLLNSIDIEDIFTRKYKKIKNPLAVIKNIRDFYNNRNQNNELKDILKNFYRRSQEDSQEFLIVLMHLLDHHTKYKGLQDTRLFCENNTSRFVEFPHIPNKPLQNEYETINLALIKDPSRSVTIQDCLDYYQIKETLDDPITEGNCTEKNITIVPYKDSTNVIFQLKRFNNALTKDSSPIIPNPTIALFANRERTASVNYQLTGCIIHTGGVTLNSGHYTYLSFKNGLPGMYINDSRISKYNPQKDPSFHENGYVYLYTKI